MVMLQDWTNSEKQPPHRAFVALSNACSKGPASGQMFAALAVPWCKGINAREVWATDRQTDCEAGYAC